MSHVAFPEVIMPPDNTNKVRFLTKQFLSRSLDPSRAGRVA